MYIHLYQIRMYYTNQLRPNYNRLSDRIYETYLLFAISVFAYLASSQKYTGNEFAGVSIFASIIMLLMLVYYDAPIYLFFMAFFMGMSHNYFFHFIGLVEPYLVSQALGITGIVFIGLSYFAYNCVNYIDFAVYSMLYSLLSSIIMFSIMNIFFQSAFFDLVLVVIGINVFSGFIIIDTRNIIDKPYLSPRQIAAHLFLDFVNMFIKIIKLLKHLKRKN